MTTSAVVLAHEGTTGGAPLDDLIPATIVALVALVLVSVLGLAHRRGATQVLNRLAAFAERVAGLPGWAALPAAICGGSLLVAVFGFYWDVPTHIDNGRDPGPFANSSHLLIIAGLSGIALAGVVSVLLGRDDDEGSVRIARGWHAPAGGVLMLICGAIAVAGFPLDDVWHRLFGQDVTLWSPTHLQMVGGAALSTLALWILVVEGSRRATRDLRPGPKFVREGVIAGAFLIGLSAFQAEFDYSVPQFRLLYHPMLVMASAGIALVAARMRLGRGGALATVGVFILVRGVLSLVIGPGMGHTTLHFPLYVFEALAVEAIALRRDLRSPSSAALAGIGLGTVGLAAEWGWSHAWMTMPWPPSLLLEGVALGFVAAVAGACTGALIGDALTGTRRAGVRFSPRVAAGSLAALLVVLAWPFPTDTSVRPSATIGVVPVDGDATRARVTVEVEPPEVAANSEWFNVTSWQGGGSYVEALEPRGGGRYATTAAVPVAGGWKTQVRLHDGRSLLGVPVYLPEDKAIPAAGVPAPDGRERRDFLSDKELLLREAKEGVSPVLVYGASAVMALIVAIWLVLIAWALRRVSSARPPEGAPRRVVAHYPASA